MSARLLPMLSAEDFQASLRFYGDLLGGVEAYRFPEDEPVFVTLRFGEAELGIGGLGGNPIHGQPQRCAHRWWVNFTRTTTSAPRLATTRAEVGSGWQPRSTT